MSRLRLDARHCSEAGVKPEVAGSLTIGPKVLVLLTNHYKFDQIRSYVLLIYLSCVVCKTSLVEVHSSLT